MSVAPNHLDNPPPGSRFRRNIGPVSALRELGQARELLRALTTREFRARYRQTALGVSWAVITPVMLMIAFVVVVDRVADVDTGGAPYALFTYLGLLPWSFFSSSMSRGGTILVLESSLLNKVRCPREVFPISTIAVAGIDFAAGLLVLLILFVVTGTAPQPESLWFPVILLVQVAFVIGATLAVSATVVYVRDLGQALPLLLQVGLFATPVAYGIERLSDDARTLYALVNPLVGVIASYRATVLDGTGPPWEVLGPSALSAAAWLLLGWVLFKRLEAGIADVA